MTGIAMMMTDDSDDDQDNDDDDKNLKGGCDEVRHKFVPSFGLQAQLHLL